MVGRSWGEGMGPTDGLRGTLKGDRCVLSLEHGCGYIAMHVPKSQKNTVKEVRGSLYVNYMSVS